MGRENIMISWVEHELFYNFGPEIRPFLSINARITSKGDNFDQELFIFLLIRIIYDLLEESEIQQILFLSAIDLSSRQANTILLMLFPMENMMDTHLQVKIFPALF